METFRQEFQSIRIVCGNAAKIAEPEKTFPLGFCKFSAMFHRRPVPQKFLADRLFHHLEGKLVSGLLHGFQGKTDDRIFSHVRKIALSGLHNFQALEQCGGVSGTFFKKVPEHAHIQCFPKTAGAGKQIYFTFHIQKIFDQERLVDIKILFMDQFLKVIHSYRKRFPTHKQCLPS